MPSIRSSSLSTTAIILLLPLILNNLEAQLTTPDPRSSIFSTTSSAKETTTPDNSPFIETYLIGPFKVWHVAGFVFTGLITIVIGICCMIDLRVPRTKEEIEQNYEKRQAAHKYVDKLGKLDFHGVQTKSQAVLQKENEMKKKTKGDKSANKDKTSDKKPEKSGKATPKPGRAMFNPGSMMGMMGGYPGMMMGGQTMNHGAQTPGGASLAESMQGSRGMHPAMMNPMMMNMWRSQSMGNLQMESPMLQRANSSTSLQGQQTPKMKRLVEKLREAKAKGELDEEDKDDEKDDKTEEEPSDKGTKLAGKKKKWGKK